MPAELNGPEPLKPPARPSALTQNLILAAAVCLIIAIGASGLFPRSRPAYEQPKADGAPQAAPAAPAKAEPGYGGNGQGHLTPAGGGGAEEDIKPPAPGLLMPKLSMETLSYTGPATDPGTLAKETAEDKAGCKAGDMFKCMRLGRRYMAGHGVERDAARAFTFINKACAGGIAEACTMQGIMQISGYGTPVDVQAGVALQEKTCAAGDMAGCAMLGGIYVEGKVRPLDVPRGLGYLHKACDAKNASACLELGALFNDGKVVPRDPGTAEYLFGRACEYSDRTACQMEQQLAQRRLAAKNGR